MAANRQLGQGNPYNSSIFRHHDTSKAPSSLLLSPYKHMWPSTPPHHIPFAFMVHPRLLLYSCSIPPFESGAPKSDS